VSKILQGYKLDVCVLGITLSIYFLANPSSDMNMFPTKPSKTIDPPGKPEGNATHKM
jgi:hypothetical protein